MSTVASPHIELRSGIPVISGTRIKVRHVAREHRDLLWEAPQIQRRYPFLSLAQIHSALAYYYDHKSEIDAELREEDELADKLEEASKDSPIRQKLKGMGLLP